MNTFLVPPWLYFITYIAKGRRPMQYDVNDLLAMREIYRVMVELLRDLKREERNFFMRQVYRYAHGWALRQEYAIREMLESKVAMVGYLSMN